MYDQILKFGSMIVDALSQYKSGPILVYIPPLGELRGGAWAVLDPAINRAKIEIYADPESRSSVLEPEGTVQVKNIHSNFDQFFIPTLSEFEICLNLVTFWNLFAVKEIHESLPKAWGLNIF